jgi:hypothetical protein
MLLPSLLHSPRAGCRAQRTRLALAGATVVFGRFAALSRAAAETTPAPDAQT